MPPKTRKQRHIAFGPSHPGLDEVNAKLISELHRNPRLTMSALARIVGMSAPAVTDRIRRMQDEGIITGFRMDINPAALGLPVLAFVRVRPGPGQLPNLMALAGEHEQVSECHRVTGDDCLMLKIHTATIDGLEAVLDEFLLYGQTTTSLVVATPVQPRPLPLPPTGG
jgi:Lrp/AsnC family leucine-responsive transcriptional regulator